MPKNKVCTAIARELLGFIWAIAWEQHGAAVASGVYLTRLHHAGGMQQTRPLLYLK